MISSNFSLSLYFLSFSFLLLIDADEAYGFDTPPPIQARCLAPILAGQRNIYVRADAGIDRASAVAIAALSRIDTSQDTTQAIVLTTTRECAMALYQIFKNLNSSQNAAKLGVTYGGMPIRSLLQELKESTPHVVIGTFGRVRALIERGALSMDGVTMLAMDDVEEALSRGFDEYLEFYFERMQQRIADGRVQRIAFSELISEALIAFVDKHLVSQTNDKLDELVCVATESCRQSIIC
ncbi:P-loop containing nucleoside triphosphate hydrolase protein [Ramicandelaber brevisporus]|nr:P-loop containing nucleoside triphosphate hydrolase protein [Ramicandelaber brevisporus]